MQCVIQQLLLLTFNEAVENIAIRDLLVFNYLAINLGAFTSN